MSQGFKIYGKSFPGRAAILIKLLDINENIMPAVFEKEKSEKIDHYVPSTKIKIISDTNWIENKMMPELMIIWGWHIPNEIKKYLGLATPNTSIEIIDLTNLPAQTKVAINQGLFMNRRGEVIKSSKHNVFVRLESLNLVMIVEFKPHEVSPI